MKKAIDKPTYKIFFEKIDNPNDLQIFLAENIKYGFVSKTGKKYFFGDKNWGRDWYKSCIVQSADKLLETKCGTCWDQVELERKWFFDNNYKFNTYFFWFDIGSENNHPTHTILAFEENNKFYWFENSFYGYRGIHEYNTINELINDIKQKHIDYAIKSGVAKPSDMDVLRCFRFDKPKPNIGVEEYFEHVFNNRNEVIS